MRAWRLWEEEAVGLLDRTGSSTLGMRATAQRSHSLQQQLFRWAPPANHKPHQAMTSPSWYMGRCCIREQPQVAPKPLSITNLKLFKIMLLSSNEFRSRLLAVLYVRRVAFLCPLDFLSRLLLWQWVIYQLSIKSVINMKSMPRLRLISG